MDNRKLKELIKNIARDQDKKSFVIIFNYFAPRIMGYLIISGSKKEIAEEITQDVLGIVWKKAIQFDFSKGNAKTWIFTIARNKRIDRLRKNDNPSYNTIDFIDAFYPKKEENKEEVDKRVVKMLSKLNEKEKKLIKMNFFEGKTHKIIAKDLEIPLGTVKSRIRNILIKMKN